MILDAPSAATFIEGYKRLLLRIAGPQDKGARVLDAMVVGRQKLISQPSLLDSTLPDLQPDGEFAKAVRTLQVKQWVYLRDTRSYSVFLEPSGEAAYAVIGLTDRVRTLIGGSGALIETGMLHYKQKHICDGLVSSVIWLGPEYMRNFNETLRRLKATGQFTKQSQAQQVYMDSSRKHAEKTSG